ncbi:MAG TPA: hypothetical protein VGM94_10575 [Galbitalea sp.]|jgi:hypothetical protein
MAGYPLEVAGHLEGAVMALHVTLIVLHATFAVVSFGFGCSLLAVLPASVRSPRFLSYYFAAWAAVLLLITVVAVDWSGLPVVKRVAFAALCVLAAYLLFRTERARSTLQLRQADWRKRFVGHVGFVLISLFDGFCIVSAIDLHLPPYVIAIVAVAGVAIGILVIRRVVRRDAARASRPPVGIT